jgi:predicted O-linked N-acetylglucosamine transferase (SPINDLY family)
MGVPVISLAGLTHPARMGLSILNAVGLGELVALDEGEYVSIATAMAADTARLVALRQGMRNRLQRSALFDRETFTRDFERLLSEAAERCAAQPTHARHG